MVMPRVKYFWKMTKTMMMGTAAKAAPAIMRPKSVEFSSCIFAMPVQGSAEAVKANLMKLNNEEVAVKVIHSGVGAINESDILLASTANAIIVGFNVRPDAAAAVSAQRSNVDVRLYSVIYECLEEIEAAMKGMLAPKYREVVIGHAEVRVLYKVSAIGTVAGCYVKDGKITRDAKVRVLRDNVVIYTGELGSLQRFKDSVKEVQANFECGMSVAKYNDIKEGDGTWNTSGRAASGSCACTSTRTAASTSGTARPSPGTWTPFWTGRTPSRAATASRSALPGWNGPSSAPPTLKRF